MTNEVVAKIKSAGYWGITISPARFQAERLPLQGLFPILEKCQISFRGREFPRIDRKPTLVPDRTNSISQKIERHHHLEAWRFYRSGQFTDLRAMQTDWLDKLPGGPPYQDWQSGVSVYIEHVLIAFGDAFEFANRLSSTPAGDETTNVEITVGGLRGRSLTVADQINHLDRVGGSQQAVIDEFKKSYRCSRIQLVAETRELTILAAQDLFAVFGKSVSVDLLREWAKDLLVR